MDINKDPILKDIYELGLAIEKLPASELATDLSVRVSNLGISAESLIKSAPTQSVSPPNSKTDMVNHPPHYKNHPSGIECIQITEHYGFCIGNAIKYLWRADHKGSSIEDLKKAIWYINREIQKRESSMS